MAKYWMTGTVKTRLGAAIGMESAAMLHRLFVSHLCRQLDTVADRRVVCLAPAGQWESFRRDLDSWGLAETWDVVPQGEGDLGQRMEQWFRYCFDHQSPFADDQGRGVRSGEVRSGGELISGVLIGADCPTLGGDEVKRAGDLLIDHDAVLGPAADGGYYLIGLKGPWNPCYTSLFREIAWSTDRVFDETSERIAAAGLSCAELEVREDIDTLPELDRLRNTLAQDDSAEARTLREQIEQVLLLSGCEADAGAAEDRK